MSQIEIKNLTKKFIQGSNEIYAVNNVSMQIEKGEMVAITGQSGSGKTTLLNLIGGIETPTSGSVFFDGINICELDNGELSKLRRTKIGYVFQDFNLIPILTVEENIQMPWLLNSQKVVKNDFGKSNTFWAWRSVLITCRQSFRAVRGSGQP